jgi:peptidyl-tRNA hydrolase
MARKLFIVVRQDLPPGRSYAQVAHAITEYAMLYQACFEAWYEASNTIAVLQVPTMVELAQLCDRAEFEGCRKAEFHEPDLQNELTAVAFEPSDKSRFLKKLELLSE